MTDGQKAIVVLGAAGLGWYLYTRSKGLTLTGQYANPMLAPGSMSLVTPSTATSTQNTNPFAAIGTAVTSLSAQIAKLFTTNANKPASQPATAAGITPGRNSPETFNAGYATAGEPIPPPSNALAQADPWWMWDTSFELPSQQGVPSLDWTLPENANYIPPPPQAA